MASTFLRERVEASRVKWECKQCAKIIAHNKFALKCQKRVKWEFFFRVLQIHFLTPNASQNLRYDVKHCVVIRKFFLCVKQMWIKPRIEKWEWEEKNGKTTRKLNYIPVNAEDGKRKKDRSSQYCCCYFFWQS